MFGCSSPFSEACLFWAEKLVYCCFHSGHDKERMSAAVSGSVLKTSAHNESVPRALLFPRVAIAALISAFFGGNVSISVLLSAGWISAVCCGSDLFSTSLKCSVHLRSCSFSLVSNFPSLYMTGGLTL